MQNKDFKKELIKRAFVFAKKVMLLAEEITLLLEEVKQLTNILGASINTLKERRYAI